MRDVVDNVFILGILLLWDEVCYMLVGGVWWFNVDCYVDVVSLFNQMLVVQVKNSYVVVLVMGNKFKDIIFLDYIYGLDNIVLFILLNCLQVLEEIYCDLVCFFESGNYLFILLCVENVW